jgi:hypothetical protein
MGVGGHQKIAQKSAGVVTYPFEAKRTAPVFFGDRRGNQRVTQIEVDADWSIAIFATLAE